MKFLKRKVNEISVWILQKKHIRINGNVHVFMYFREIQTEKQSKTNKKPKQITKSTTIVSNKMLIRFEHICN